MSVSPVKDSYLLGEPLLVTCTFHNKRSSAVSVDLGWARLEKFAFAAGNETLKTLPAREFGSDSMISTLTLTPGEKYKLYVPLQKWLTLKLGKHKVQAFLDSSRTNTYITPSSGRPPVLVRASNTFTVYIRSGKREELSRALVKWLKLAATNQSPWIAKTIESQARQNTNTMRALTAIQNEESVGVPPKLRQRVLRHAQGNGMDID